MKKKKPEEKKIKDLKIKKKKLNGLITLSQFRQTWISLSETKTANQVILFPTLSPIDKNPPGCHVSPFILLHSPHYKFIKMSHFILAFQNFQGSHAAAAKLLQSCPTLCDPIDASHQPTRLPRPWDSLGKNTGVGCHFLFQCMKVKSEKWSRSVVPNSQRPHGLQPARGPPSMGFSRQEYWSGLPLPSPSDLMTMLKNLLVFPWTPLLFHFYPVCW